MNTHEELVRQARKKERDRKKEQERARAYIRQHVSFLPFDFYLKTNPKFHRDVADGVYNTITLAGSNSTPYSALEILANDAMQYGCSFVCVNKVVVIPAHIAISMLNKHELTRESPTVTYLATGFYRAKPKSKRD